MIGIRFVLKADYSINHGWKQGIMLMKLLRSVMIATQNIQWKCKNKIDANLMKQFITQLTVRNHAN
jgi:hypothetical protein